MGNSSGLDKGLMALIQNVLGTRHNAPLPEAELPEDNPGASSESLGAETSQQPEAEGPVEETAATPPDQPESYDRRKTADELAGIILKALQTLDGAPARGFVVTVYGGNPWNAMLTIKPEAGPIADPGLWRTRVRDMAARLRQDFDLAEM
ncbi:hypothetical protein [Nitrobacter sp. TKz-YC02]|uniref:hypothetical protein n=1 Tax=Nitrobacter sp. TKz-YC02 TaxID=3398704 RepID=UPI003CEA61B0